MKGRTDYNEEKGIYLKQQVRDRLNILESKKKLSNTEKHKMTKIKIKDVIIH